MAPFSFRTVGFDLDGTLLDTIGDIAAAANHALAGMGRPTLPVDRLRPLIGGGGRHLFAQALSITGGASEAEIDAGYAELLAFYEAHPAVHTQPFPGLTVALDHLRDREVTLAVVTNKQERLARQVLTELGLVERFATVIGGDTLGPGRGKPEPDLLRLMLERCGGPAVYVGDSVYDVRGARAAGLPVVACSFGYRQEPVEALAADAIIDNFAELLPALLSL